ncbi:MAG: hypothetical protein IPK71_08505 [Myxococcales bacterium]|nr:hypothetical protein [Myxococcales bacterium]
MAPRSTSRAALVLAPLLSVLVGCTILDRLSRDDEPEFPADAGTDAFALDAGLEDAPAGDAVADAAFDVSEGGDAATVTDGSFDAQEAGDTGPGDASDGG